MTSTPSLGPTPGDALPDIALTALDGSAIRPSDYAGQKLVLFFYPKDDTPGCTTENKDFTALAGDFAAAGVALLGISKDTPEKLNYGRAYMGMVRTTLLVGADGRIARVWSKVKVKDHAAQVLEAARAL